MTLAEQRAWNIAKLAELGGDALEVATVVIATWPSIRITSAARDYTDQARAMAHNAVERRDNPKTAPEDRLKWIADTYVPSEAALELQRWFEQRPSASEPDVVAGFTHIMSALTPKELRRISKHIVIRFRDHGDGDGGVCIDDRAEAVDFSPPKLNASLEETKIDDALCEYLAEQARVRGGKFLTREGGLVRRHWQAK